jgi:hypothetical protein
MSSRKLKQYLILYLYRSINSKKKRNYNSKKLNGKNAKSMSSRPFRNRRLVSVSTSFGASPNDFEESMRKMKIKENFKQNNNRSQLIGESLIEEEEDGSEEEKIDTTVPIKEVESDDDGKEESDDDDHRDRDDRVLRWNHSEIPPDTDLLDLA